MKTSCCFFVIVCHSDGDGVDVNVDVDVDVVANFVFVVLGSGRGVTVVLVVAVVDKIKPSNHVSFVCLPCANCQQDKKKYFTLFSISFVEGLSPYVTL